MASITEEFRVALDTERKFEFYFTAAIFTILGLGVDSAEVYVNRSRDILSLGGFFFLAVSALCAALALSRFVRRNWIVAELEDLEASLYSLRTERRRFPTSPRAGSDLQEAELEAGRMETLVADERARAGNLRNLIRDIRELRNWSFLLGLILLLLARVWPVFAAATGAPGGSG